VRRARADADADHDDVVAQPPRARLMGNTNASNLDMASFPVGWARMADPVYGVDHHSVFRAQIAVKTRGNRALLMLWAG
jgi:hypothetical protein